MIEFNLRLRVGRSHHHDHHRRATPVLHVGTFAVRLVPQEQIHMASQLHIDQLGNLSITFADSTNNPIVPAPTPDAPPTWTVDDLTVATIVVAADGMSAVMTPIKVSGVSTVTLALVVGGTKWGAVMAVTIVAGAIASVAIVLTPVPKP